MQDVGAVRFGNCIDTDSYASIAYSHHESFRWRTIAFLLGVALLTVSLTATGCGGTASSQSSPTQFDPSQGTATDKVRWGGQFASANDTTTGPIDNYDGQARVIETFGKGGCTSFDAGASIKDAISSYVTAGRISQHDAIVFAAIAVTAYCPKHKPEFDALMHANNVVLKQTSWTPADNTYGGPTSTDKTHG